MEAQGDSTEARVALGLLCETYYAPVLNYIKRNTDFPATVYGVRGAEDICHDFFLRVLRGEEFKHLERGPGRFRSYLLGAVRFYLAGLREEQAAFKRGGGMVRVALETELPQKEQKESGDAQFDHDWAVTLVSHAIAQLHQEAKKRDQVEQFDILRRWLLGAPPNENRDRAARALGVTKDHFKVLLSRTRKKFRDNIRLQIAQTVERESDIDGELDYLIEALSAGR